MNEQPVPAPFTREQWDAMNRSAILYAHEAAACNFREIARASSECAQIAHEQQREYYTGKSGLHSIRESKSGSFWWKDV